jgi:UPF0755 protein
MRQQICQLYLLDMDPRKQLKDAHARAQEWRVYDRVLPAAFLIGVLVFLLYFITFAPPSNFPTGLFVNIPPNESIPQAAQVLQNKGVIRSAYLFETVLDLRYGMGGTITAGEYFFPGPQNLITVARRLADGNYELVPVRVTIPEGTDTQEMGALFAEKIPDFNEQDFLTKSASKEGYLFPDTYFFLPGESADDVMQAMEDNFTQQISTSSVRAQITLFGKPLSDVITMASILEKEAADTKDRRIISGILWKRISLGMPLQVDAVFPYIIDKNSFQLTRSDLKTNSPYNTYTNKGLPPGPIASPGLDAILAAVNPTKSNYLYYLSDLHGTMHYCATYACQLVNQKKYLGT